MADGQVFNNNNTSFVGALSLVKPTSLEERVQILWNAILSTWFPPTHGYLVAVKAAVLADNSQPDAVVFEIRNLAHPRAPTGSGDFLEKQIFIVECKRPALDTPGEWISAGTGQLRHYIEQNTNENTERMYGAVAIGTKVQFWQYDENDNHVMRPLHQHVFDLRDGTQRRNFEAMLTHVRTHGWNFAS